MGAWVECSPPRSSPRLRKYRHHGGTAIKRLRPKDERTVLVERVRIVGFAILKNRRNLLKVVREDRISRIVFEDHAVVVADDPRDIWLLRIAVRNAARFIACETYFVRRRGNEDTDPLEVRLRVDAANSVYLEHDLVDGGAEAVEIRDIDHLAELLPPLVAPNVIGYHLARQSILDCYEKARPRTWAEVGVSDPGLISEYVRHSVRPDDVRRANESGILGMDAIITAFGMPADDEWGPSSSGGAAS